MVYVCERDRAVSKTDIDRSIITKVRKYLCDLMFGTHHMSRTQTNIPFYFKRVLPHGSEEQCQSEDVDNNNTEEEGKDTKDTHVSYLSLLIPPCWRRNTKDKVAPEEDILETYRAKNHVCAHCNSLRIHNGVVEDNDELVLAEEGECIAEEMTCNICLEAFEVGQKVSWSKEGCQHVFHYDCILPWAVMGNVRCPVCREVYWCREKSRLCCRRKESESAIEMRKKTFCVIHGFKSPTDTAEDGDGIIPKPNNLSKVESKSWGYRATPPPVAAFHISDNDNQ